MGISYDDKDDVKVKGVNVDSGDDSEIGSVTDDDGNERLLVTTDGARDQAELADMTEMFCLLRDILKQLKITNVHLMNLSDLELEDGDEWERW